MTLNMTVKTWFLTALVVAVRFKTNYEQENRIFTTILAKKTSSNIEKLEFLQQICYSVKNEAQRCS